MMTQTFPTSTISTPRDRALDDLLRSEKEQREQSEATVTQLKELLLSIATRIDGKRLDDLRHEKPGVPGTWGAKEWREFFNGGWGISSFAARQQDLAQQRDLQERRELLQQIESLKAKLSLTEKALEQERAKPQAAAAAPDGEDSATPKQSFVLSADTTPPASRLVTEVKSILPTLPQELPASYSGKLTGGGRSGKDLAKAFQRYWITLYLIGRWGLASAVEVDDVMSEVVDVGSGSLKRIQNDLINSDVIAAEPFKNTQSSLLIARLLPDGEKLYQAIFSQRPVENEWARLIRTGKDASYIQLVITAAMHARKRGYAAQIIPGLKEADTSYDLRLVRDGQTLHVKTEPSLAGEKRDWRSLSAMNAGKVAVITWTLADRALLVSECRKLGVSGMATDLETLVKTSYKSLNETSPLWLESW
jgi:hypothetical protein